MLLPLVACSAGAAKWDITPSISAEERYTDNVGLAPDASKRGEWITKITPGISVAANGAQLRFNAIYDPDVVYYARGQYDTQVYQRGNAVGTAELAKKLLFLDFGAKADQYNASLQAPQAANNANATGNLATVSSYYASPYLRQDFGSNVQGEARFTGSVVNSDDRTQLANSVADRVDLRLNSGAAYKLFTWNVDYFRENDVYEDEQNNILSQVIKANAKRLITSTVGLIAQVGYDRYRVGPETLEGTAWNAGFDWTPSPRTRFAVTAGRRFYGDDYSLDLSHRTRRTTWSAVYSQNITTTRAEFFAPDPTRTAGYLNTLFSSQYSDPVAREKAVQDFIARTSLPPGLVAQTNFFTSELILVKRWQASVGVLGARNVVLAYLYRETREALTVGAQSTATAGDFALGDTVTQTGVSSQWNWRMTARNSWNMSAGYNRNEFSGANRVDNVKYVGMGLSRQIEPKLVGALNYRRQQSDSNALVGNYTENAVFATIQKRF